MSDNFNTFSRIHANALWGWSWTKQSSVHLKLMLNV